MFTNTNEFRREAIYYDKHGRYDDGDYGSKHWNEYWDMQEFYCLNGFSSGGVKITGRHYFHLNFSRMATVTKEQVNGRKIVNRKVDFPKFWDEDYNYYWIKEIAKNGILKEDYKKLELDVSVREDCLKGGKHIIWLKPRGVGAEQPHSEILITPDGEITMGDVKVGTKLFDKYGKVTTVTEVLPQGYKEVWEIELLDGRKVTCGENHLWTVEIRLKNGVPQYRTFKTKELLEKGLIYKHKTGQKTYKYKIPELKPVQFKYKELPIPPYVLGALLGDGTINGKNIKIASNDIEIVNKIISDLNVKWDNDFEAIKDTSNNNYILKLKDRNKYLGTYNENSKYGCNPLKQELELLNINVKCEDKHIPNIYKYGSIEQRLELIKGLMDTDGSISEQGYCEFTNKSKKLIDDLAYVLRSLGIYCSIGEDNRVGEEHTIKKEGRKDITFNRDVCYRLYIATNQNIFNLKRKNDRINTTKRTKTSCPIINIKKTGIFEKQSCIIVDNKEHLYLTKDFIVTHNSYKAGSGCAYNYHLMKDSRTICLASSKQYLTVDGLINKFLDVRDFINNYRYNPITKVGQHGFYQSKVKGDMEAMHFISGRLGSDGTSVIGGKKAEIIGVNLNGDPEKARGKRSLDIYFEEFGSFKGADIAWNVAIPSVEQEEDVFGTLTAFGTGGCVCAGTKIWTNDGNLINIEDLKPEMGIIGYKDNEGFSKEDITYWQPPTQKQCYRITTNTKRTLECSNDHPIYKLIGRDVRPTTYNFDFVETETLKIGDTIGVIDEVPIFGNQKMWNPRLIGWLIGDGSYGKDQTVKFSNCEPEILEPIEKTFTHTIGENYITKLGKQYKTLNLQGFTVPLRELGIYGQTKLQKTLPININTYTKEDICELLGGLFDTDGYVSLRKDKRNNNNIIEISISQASENLLNEIRFLLQKLGIHGRMRERLPRDNKDRKIKDVNSWYEFTIADSVSLLNFYKNIKLLPEEKKKRLDLIPESYKDKPILNRYKKGVVLETITNVEDIGIKDIYNLTAGNTHTYIANGIITHNTEGEGFAAMEKMFYDPDTYNCIAVNNKWDEGAEGTFCSYFTPAYKAVGFIDENGNSKQKEAREFYESKRKIAEKSPDGSDILRTKAEKPFCPREAVLITTGNPFLSAELLEHINELKAKRSRNGGVLGVPINLVYTSDGIKHSINDTLKPIPNFPITKDDTTRMNLDGCIMMYDLPYKDATTKQTPPNLYIICHDPYSHDSSLDKANMSLGATYVIERINNITKSKGDVIVASYVGRPKSQDEYNENLFKLAQFYNAKIGAENNTGDIYGYAKRNKLLQYVEQQFTLAYDAKLATKAGMVRTHGMHITGERKNQGLLYLRDWLYNIRATDELTGKPILTLHTITDIPLLEEFAKFNDVGNFDRISAMLVGMYQDREYIYLNKKPKNNSSGIQDFYLHLQSGFGSIFK